LAVALFYGLEIPLQHFHWELTVFRNFIVPLLEEDVQHIYIKSMSIQDGKLVLVAEDARGLACRF